MRHITITPYGYLASIPKTGPGLVVLAKLQKLVFRDAEELGWSVRLSNVHSSERAEMATLGLAVTRWDR